jgi:hypothetical protein
MPFLYENNKVAVELEELVPRFWNSLDSLQKELLRYKERSFGIKRLQVGGNGRRLLVDFDSLKPEYQDALGDPRKVDHPMALFYKEDAEARRYYATFKRNGVALKADEQERYVINASVMQAVVVLERKRTQERMKLRGSVRGIMETLIYDVNSFQDHLRVNYGYEHTLPVSKRFKQALKDFKANSYYSLIKDPNGTGKQNARKVDDRVLMILNALFKNQSHKPSPTEISRNYEAFLSGYAEVYNEDSGELYNPKEFPKLSEATIINYINDWQNRIATHAARSGDRQKYMGQYKPHHQMEMPTLAGSVISIDDRQPPFIYNEKGDRIWYYIGMDVASRCFTTFVYGKTKEGLIVDFYRQMVRNYTDWGFCLPFELECESSLNSSYRDTLLRPGAMFQEVRIEANNARAKYIERAFGELRYGHEKQEEGWMARPTAISEKNQAGPLQAKGKKQMVVPFDQLVEMTLTNLQDWNNKPHPTNANVSIWEYFQSHQNPNLKPTNWAGILPHIGYKTRTSCKLGYITLQGEKRAIAEAGNILLGEALIEVMKVIEDKEVDVYWLDANDGSVLKALVYHKDRLICEAQSMPKYNRAKAERTEGVDDMAYQIQSSYVASVEAFAKRQRNNIENINISFQAKNKPANGFQIPNLKRFQLSEEPVEILEDNDDNLVLINNAQPAGWRSNFNL